MPLSRIITFLLVVTTINGLLHYYVWARLIRDTAIPEPWAKVATITLIVLGVMVMAGLIARRFFSNSLSDAMVWIGLTWLGLLFLLFTFNLLGDVAHAAIRFANRAAPPDPARREFLARAIGGFVAVGASTMGVSGMASALGSVAVKRVSVTLKKLARALDGYKIAQWSDVHVGPTIGRKFIEELVAKTNALNPDMVVITGDLVDGSVAELGADVEPIRNLRAKDGVFFITGNHEYYSGAKEWIAFLETLGVKVLRNERVAIRGAEGFDLGGVDDWHAHQFYDDHGPKLSSVIEGRDKNRALVLLAHQPKQITEAAEHGVDLQLSGHTHGGQIFPFNYMVYLQQPFVAGLDKLKETQIYVSCGTGYWGPPMRVGAPAEITEVTLRSA